MRTVSRLGGAFKVLRLIGLSQMFRGEIQAANETGERLMKLALSFGIQPLSWRHTARLAELQSSQNAHRRRRTFRQGVGTLRQR